MWPAVYITLFFSAVWALFIGALNIALISMHDESAISLLPIMATPFVMGIGTIFLLSLFIARWTYQHSNEASYLRLTDLLLDFSS